MDCLVDWKKLLLLLSYWQPIYTLSSIFNHVVSQLNLWAHGRHTFSCDLKESIPRKSNQKIYVANLLNLQAPSRNWKTFVLVGISQDWHNVVEHYRNFRSTRRFLKVFVNGCLGIFSVASTFSIQNYDFTIFFVCEHFFDFFIETFYIIFKRFQNCHKFWKVNHLIF